MESRCKCEIRVDACTRAHCNWKPVGPVVGDPVRQDNDKRYEHWEVLSSPSALCTLIGNFHLYIYIYIYLCIVSLVVILSNWVCDNWVYRFTM